MSDIIFAMCCVVVSISVFSSLFYLVNAVFDVAYKRIPTFKKYVDTLIEDTDSDKV